MILIAFPVYRAGTGTPSHGGSTYYDVLENTQGLTQAGDVVASNRRSRPSPMIPLKHADLGPQLL